MKRNPEIRTKIRDILTRLVPQMELLLHDCSLVLPVELLDDILCLCNAVHAETESNLRDVIIKLKEDIVR